MSKSKGQKFKERKNAASSARLALAEKRIRTVSSNRSDTIDRSGGLYGIIACIHLLGRTPKP